MFESRVERLSKQRNVILLLDTMDKTKEIPEHIRQRYPEEVYAFEHDRLNAMYEKVKALYNKYVNPLQVMARKGRCMFEGSLMRGGRDKLLWKDRIYYAYEYPLLLHGFETMIELMDLCDKETCELMKKMISDRAHSVLCRFPLYDQQLVQGLMCQLLYGGGLVS